MTTPTRKPAMPQEHRRHHAEFPRGPYCSWACRRFPAEPVPQGDHSNGFDDREYGSDARRCEKIGMESIFRFPRIRRHDDGEQRQGRQSRTAVPPSPMVMRLPDPTGDAPIEAIFNPLKLFAGNWLRPKRIRTLAAVSAGMAPARLDLCQQCGGGCVAGACVSQARNRRGDKKI